MDEAVGICSGRAALLAQSQRPAAGSQPRFTDRADGTRAYDISSMEQLHSFLATGRP